MPIAVLALRHRGIVHRTRRGRRTRERVPHAGPGREGRTSFAAVAGPPGPLPFAYLAPVAYLGETAGAADTAAWRRSSRGSGLKVDLEEEEA
ncbi:hypothetical protein [Actinomadura livida]|uniref:Uncharacterized protein n=1 Tax=Actinomadura livida TaxID=79909 RepID=A0A7W7IJ54_9ACTN|nr:MULTISPECIES: hypothetical protein [Actinomadura]MBB4777989.1 hypothetical protein [Actinomadura catellatispora]GGT97405.1 hypothetical protein GCM10010208_20860 [Actinomadura livida]